MLNQLRSPLSLLEIDEQGLKLLRAEYNLQNNSLHQKQNMEIVLGWVFNDSAMAVLSLFYNHCVIYIENMPGKMNETNKSLAIIFDYLITAFQLGLSW